MAGLLSSQRKQPTGGLLSEPITIDERVAGLLGLDPTIERGAILPMGRDANGEMVLAWPQMAVDSLKSLMLPGHVMKGGSFTPRDVTEMALDVGMLSSVVPGPAGAKRMFGGINAKNAPLDDLAKAETMEKAGKAADDIWRATGWGRGADGKWRFEIDDSEAFMDSVGKNAPEGYFKLQHEDVRDQYPEMWGTLQQSIRRGDTDTGSIGQYNPQTNTLKVRGKTGHKSTALHELQHAVQSKEDFAKGGSSEYGVSGPIEYPLDLPRWDVLDAADKIRRLADQFGEAPSAMAQKYRAAFKIDDESLAQAIDFAANPDLSKLVERGRSFAEMKPYEAYRRLAGEVEARNVQKRMNMDAAERRATPPWATEDVPRDQQIVRGLLNY